MAPYGDDPTEPRRPRDGRAHTLATVPEPDVEADAGRAAGPLRDVSGEREGQDALREAQELARCLFESAPIATMILDLDGCYERVNDAFCAMVGYNRAQLVGRTGERITHREDVAADAALLRALMADDLTSDRSRSATCTPWGTWSGRRSASC